MLIELFSLGVIAEALRANGSKSAISLQRGPVEWVPHQPFFSKKTRLNDLLFGVKIWADLSFVLSHSQCTRLTDVYGQTDRQTDKRTDRQLSSD